MIKKRAQAWGFDLMIGTSIFLMGILVFLIYALSSNAAENEKIKLMQYESNSIGESIISDGTPSYWTTSNVNKIGILTDGKVNETKLEMFYDLSSSDYERTKSIFNIGYDYFFNFSEIMYIRNSSVEGIGKKIENQTDLIKITRFTIYQNKPLTANIYLWR